MSIFERTLVDEETADSHKAYDEYERRQFIINLDIGEKIEIKIYDKLGKIVNSKEFIAKYVNCHINCQWQDKGIKKIEEIL